MRCFWIWQTGRADPIQRIEVQFRLEDGKVIEFGRVKSEDGRIKRVACSNVPLRVIRGG